MYKTLYRVKYEDKDARVLVLVKGMGQGWGHTIFLTNTVDSHTDMEVYARIGERVPRSWDEEVILLY